MNRSLRTYVIFFFLLSLLVAPTACGPSLAGIWNSNGPEGGGTVALAIDPATPTTLYAGMDGRGVFKSTDSGAHWSATNTGLTNNYIFALAIDPATPTTLYAGTHPGVFKSTDGGANWSAVNTGLTYNYFDALTIDPATPTTLYAGTEDDGVFKSTDGGANWSAVNTGLTNKYIYALAIDPTRPTTLYTGTRGGVFKSTDGGANWSAVSIGLPETYIIALTIDPATPTTLYAGTQKDGVFKSTDGGANWSRVGITGLTGTYIMALTIDPATPTTVYAGASGYGGVFKSTDGGANWNTVGFGLSHNIRALAIDPTTRNLYAGTYGGGVFSIQQAVTEQPATGTLPTLPLDWLLGILAVALIGAAVWGVRRLPFPDQPRLPDWFVRVLTAVWPVELIFACVLAASIVLVTPQFMWQRDELLGIAVLVGVVTYVLGLIIAKSSSPWWIEFGSGCSGGYILLFFVLGFVFLAYYVLIAATCRKIILPIVFRVVGISGARIPPVFGKPKSK